jgi:preprotein translocase subunit SecD
MKNALLLMAAGWFTLTAGAAGSLPSVLQIRSVLDGPSADSEQMPLVSKTGKEVFNVRKTVLLDQSAVMSATVHDDPLGQPQIEIKLNDEGRKRFAEVSRQNLGKRLAIVIDGQLYCAPVIRAEITGGKAEITGGFTEREAKDLAKKITDKLTK